MMNCSFLLLKETEALNFQVQWINSRTPVYQPATVDFSPKVTSGA